jgi:hypothetical protein
MRRYLVHELTPGLPVFDVNLASARVMASFGVLLM